MEAKSDNPKIAVVVPASTLTPAPQDAAAAGRPPRPRHLPGRVQIEIPPADTAASDPALINNLVDIVCSAYSESEDGIYKPGFVRTSASEIANLLRAGQLAVAFLAPDFGTHKNNNSTDTETPTSTEEGQDAGDDADKYKSTRIPIGCVYIKQQDAEIGEYGMLALHTSYRGGGLGGDLVEFAENYSREELGLSKMRLELLFPVHFSHPWKVRLQEWYLRMGYRMIDLRDFAVAYPDLNKLLAGPTEFRLFEKSLV